MKCCFALAIVFGCCFAPALGEDTWTSSGTVVDQDGNPVENFIAATFWSANGIQWDSDGEFPMPKTDEENNAVWDDEGVIAPYPKLSVQKTSGGRFTMEAPARRSAVTVFAMSPDQQVGGYCTFEKGTDQHSAIISLTPLVRVTGHITCSEIAKSPRWTCAVVHPVGDFDNFRKFTLCGSMQGKFSFLLPAGEYDIEIYGDDPITQMPNPSERDDAPKDMPPYLDGVRISISDKDSSVDLGTFDVKLTDIGKLQVAGRWGDYTKQYGKEPPPLEFSDSSGVPNEFRLEDLRGKWVLLDFWNFTCGACISESIPELSEFYAKHKSLQDRFEIISVCVDLEGGLNTIEDVESRMEPLIKNTWNGRRPEFPILVDQGGRTRARYGIFGMPKLVLIDPDGKLVDVGDQPPLEALRSKLE